MDARNKAQQAPPTASAGMDHSEEMMAEVDEPPDRIDWSPTKTHFNHIRWQPRIDRRESLLTRQLHSETEHTDEDDHIPSPPRTLSTQSTWSNQSATSMADLTSDDGRSVPSPHISPPLLPTQDHDALPVSEKLLDQKVKIVGHDDVAPTEKKETSSEKSVEANLGRKRCISFACRPKEESKPTPPPTAQPTKTDPTSPPKRKCMLKFVCPTRAGAESKPAEKTQTKRAVSPPPPLRRSSVNAKHRGSDSTITHLSPKNVRKDSAAAVAAAREAAEQSSPTDARRYSLDSDDEDGGKEAMRFHEFGTGGEEQAEWIQESTCHRSRLTVDDTLKKEHVIRKTCEEVEEEVMEEEEEDEAEDLDDELEAVAEMDDEEADEMEDDYESDEGFHSDDEGGFASSDDDSDGESDYEWWKPGGASTAATSVEQLDRLAIVNAQQAVPGTSIGSHSSSQLSPQASKVSLKRASSRRNPTGAVPINKPAHDDLPDSTDFVCGTLDEDRPLEQAYINRRKMKDAAKHKARPQDIDPSFPTSDPEMDEEDDDDVDDLPESEEDDLMHGDLDELHGTMKKSPPMRSRGKSNAQKSSPTARYHSPPPFQRRSIARSPPPPAKRGVARSPPPRKLFGHSPTRAKSPAPVKRMTSPPNSPTEPGVQLATLSHGLAGRPQLTRTASLPRGGPFTLSKLATIRSDDEDSDTPAAPVVPKRSAIDIVKGVEWKRKFRKEKLYQKMCAKAAAKGEKNHKVKPGKGAERMREVGLQLQEYHGKAEHILSL